MKQSKWLTVKPVPEHIERVHVAATDGRVFIMGQYSRYTKLELLEYHPSSDTYTSVQIDIPGSDEMQFHWSAMAAVAGKLYLVGQINIEYDITTQHVTQLPAPTAFYSAGCAAVRGKNILLCGGFDMKRSNDPVEEYNTTTRRWEIADVCLPFAFERSESFIASISV